MVVNRGWTLVIFDRDIELCFRLGGRRWFLGATAENFEYLQHSGTFFKDLGVMAVLICFLLTGFNLSQFNIQSHLGYSPKNTQNSLSHLFLISTSLCSLFRHDLPMADCKRGEPSLN